MESITSILKLFISTENYLTYPIAANCSQNKWIRCFGKVVELGTKYWLTMIFLNKISTAIGEIQLSWHNNTLSQNSAYSNFCMILSSSIYMDVYQHIYTALYMKQIRCMQQAKNSSKHIPVVTFFLYERNFMSMLY